MACWKTHHSLRWFFPATIIHCPCLMGIFQEGMFDGTRGYFDLSEHALYLWQLCGFVNICKMYCDNLTTFNEGIIIRWHSGVKTLKWTCLVGHILINHQSWWYSYFQTNPCVTEIWWNQYDHGHVMNTQLGVIKHDWLENLKELVVMFCSLERLQNSIVSFPAIHVWLPQRSVCIKLDKYVWSRSSEFLNRTVDHFKMV